MAKPPVPQRVVDPAGRVVFTGRDVQGPAGVPAQRPDGVRLGVRARRLSRPRLHRRLPAPRVEPSSRPPTAAPARTPRPADDRRPSHQPLRQAHRSPEADAPRRPRPSGCSSPTTAASSPIRRRDHGLRPTRSPTRAAAPAHRLLRLDGMGRRDRRPGHNYSYTNNWPSEPRVDNKPTADVIVWRCLSLIALLGGIGILFGVFGRWGRPRLARPRAGDAVVPHPGRRRADPGAARHRLVLLRDGRAVPAPDLRRRRRAALPGRHHRASSGSTSPSVFPYNLMRTWHVQLALFWVATSFVAAGIFLAPMIARREPRHQGKLALRAVRGARGRGLRHADRLLPRHPRLLRTPPPTGSACRASSTWTSPGSGRCCCRSACSSGSFMLWRVLRRRLRGGAPGQHAVAVLPRRLRHPGLLRGRPDRPHRRQLHDHGVLALLGRPPLGRGLPRAVHDRDGRLHVRAAGRGP